MGDSKRGVKGKSTYLNFLDKVSFGQIFMFWIVMTINFGIIYFLLSIAPEHALHMQGEPIKSNLLGLENSIYYSVITVTTTGYGEITPHGLSKLFVMLEVLFGVLLIATIISKLVSFKQETILEEIHNINYEEAFTNYRRGLSLVRTDIVMMMEKIESKTIKPREIKDLWIVFSGLDQTLTNIKNLIIPGKEQTFYNKKLDLAKVELMLNSMKLSMNKVTELVKMLKTHNLEWRDELLMTSIYYDIQTCREIIDYELKRSMDRKLIDKLNALRIILDELEEELKTNYRPRPNYDQINMANNPPKIEEVFNFPIKEEIKMEEPKKFENPEMTQPPRINHIESHEQPKHTQQEHSTTTQNHHHEHKQHTLEHKTAQHIEPVEEHKPHEAIIDPRVADLSETQENKEQTQ